MVCGQLAFEKRYIWALIAELTRENLICACLELCNDTLKQIVDGTQIGESTYP
jgi:hypothetical protein